MQETKNKNTRDEEDILKRQQECINQENKNLKQTVQEIEEKNTHFSSSKDQKELIRV